MKNINLVTSIPGPKAKEIIARRTAATPAGLAKSTEIVVEKAQGALVWDVDGNQLLDFDFEAHEQCIRPFDVMMKDSILLISLLLASHDFVDESRMRAPIDFPGVDERAQISNFFTSNV